MIYLIGKAPESPRYKRVFTLEPFIDWIRLLPAYQLDIETNVTNWWCDKQLITLQFGDVEGKDQWVIQWSALNVYERKILAMWLEDHTKLKLIHNAMFECVVLLFYGIRITNVYDTMLAEMILYCGMQFKEEEIEDDETESAAGFYALTSLQYRYLCRGMDKTEQTNFGDDILTESKVVYAATDVMPLGAIRRMQLPELSRWDLEFVAGLEMEAVLGFAEMTFNGMELDTVAWRANVELALPVIAKAKSELDEYLVSPLWEFSQYARDKGYYSETDTIRINWNSPPQKKEIVEHFFPFLQDRCSKPVLTKLLKDVGKLVRTVDGNMAVINPFSDPLGEKIARAFLEGNYVFIETILLKADRHWLIDHHYLVPAGETTINWNSRDQVLPMLRLIKKGLKGLDEESMSRFNHPIATSLKKYKEALKLITTYGESFITGTKKQRGKVEPDGKVRTSINQIVSTGRISSRRPNLQNLPVEDVGSRYLNCFLCDPGYRFVSSDFIGQELTEIAYMSQDPIWLRCLQTGEDIHSVVSELIYPGKQWEKAAEPGCAYYKLGADGKPQHHKCKCKVHDSLRYKVKRLDFGLAYGMGPGKLAGMIKVSFQAAEKLIADFFRTFPKIAQLLGQLGRFGVENGYTMTLAPFFRKRWFPYWRYSQGSIATHLAGQYDPQLGAIEREAKNMPIQGTGGDMCKVALVLIYNHIHENNLPVKLKMQIHDRLDTVATEDYAPIWEPQMDAFMREAGQLIIPNGMLKADTSISLTWSK